MDATIDIMEAAAGSSKAPSAELAVEEVVVECNVTPSRRIELSDLEIDRAIRLLGYCCGRQLFTRPPRSMRNCCGRSMCCTTSDKARFSYRKRYVYCDMCSRDTIEVMITDDDDDGSSPAAAESSLVTSAWKPGRDIIRQPFVHCNNCKRKFHKVCVLHLDAIWPEGFTCDYCLKRTCTIRARNRFTAKKLQPNILSAWLENRVQEHIKREEVLCIGNVTVRVVHSGLEQRRRNEKSQLRLCGTSESIRFRTKVVFAFEDVDGQEVCIFGMHVAECYQASMRHVYISYFDNIHFFKPKYFRTDIHNELMIGYLEYTKSMGFTWAHVGVCLPAGDDGYGFTCYSVEQNLPKIKMLEKLFAGMIKQGIKEKLIVDFSPFSEEAVDSMPDKPVAVPYTYGDCRPGEMHRTLFVIRMEPTVQIARPIIEVDSHISCDVVAGRDTFLNLCHEQQWEFCSLKWSLYSSMALLHELHTRRQDSGAFQCLKCFSSETWTYCTLCDS